MSKTRNIFEEVGSDSPRQVEPKRSARPQYARRGIAIWLAVLFLLVTAMIVVGGMTRLADAGLSITEWKPVTGALPPMDAAAWEGEFARYREIPQFELVNPNMTLAEFKAIYWWEWGHRQLGRIVGLIWALGLLWFLAMRRVPPSWTPRLLGIGFLGGVQGAIGWWMVASGLGGEMVAVASYRLAIHLGFAFAILGLIAWYFLHLMREDSDLLQARRQRNDGLIRWGEVLIGVVFAQILLGALVAGIDAGRGYVDWPLMGGEIFPSEAFMLSPGWRNFLDNPALVQFNHRLLGYILVLLGVVAWIRSRKTANLHIRRAFDAMGLALVLQLGLGISTVIHAAPWQIAIMHQLGAVLVFALVVRARFVVQYPLAQKIARGR